MNVHQIETIPLYLRYLQENPHEIDILFKELLINVTNFFRDQKAFDALKDNLGNVLTKKIWILSGHGFRVAPVVRRFTPWPLLFMSCWKTWVKT